MLTFRRWVRGFTLFVQTHSLVRFFPFLFFFYKKKDGKRVQSRQNRKESCHPMSRARAHIWMQFYSRIWGFFPPIRLDREKVLTLPWMRKHLLQRERERERERGRENLYLCALTLPKQQKEGKRCQICIFGWPTNRQGEWRRRNTHVTLGKDEAHTRRRRDLISTLFFELFCGQVYVERKKSGSGENHANLSRNLALARSFVFLRTHFRGFACVRACCSTWKP